MAGKPDPGILMSGTFSRPVTYFLWGIVAFSAVYIALIAVIPLPLYRLFGNTFEAVAALVCMGICLYAYRFWSGRIILVLAAFAFGEYALATVFWYLFTLLPLTADLGRPFAFTSVAELAFFGFMLFFIAGFQIEREREPFPVTYSILLLVLFLLVPLMIIIKYGLVVRTALLLVNFIVVAVLIIVTISHGFFRYPLIWAGICLRSLVSMLYGLRETLFLYYPSWNVTIPVQGTTFSLYELASVVGPLIIMSIALITLGLLSYIRDPENNLRQSPA
jgi:hypothetical protein